MAALRTLRQLKIVAPRLRLASAPLARLPLLAAVKPSARLFSVSSCSRAAGSATTDLATTLREELKYEVEQTEEANQEIPPFLAEFEEAGVWTIADTPGNDEVFVTRTFGDETIRAMFSIADLQALEEEDMEAEPEAEAPPTELRVSLSITKASTPGALTLDLYCSEGALQPGTVTFYPDASLATDLTIDADFKRRTLYSGPPFETLDTKIQEAFEAFLKERGIDSSLAFFVAEFAQWKEQREYVHWLEGVGKFIQA
ncbi:regulatory protein suaprga1 [Mycena belliarum]|uniref:Regulatory protein suaprga1 n=1 Tax=Mycena belliarum TaxID=1033014 RepID=A0AAD6UKW5_9AGAR|nr:regulatory protein suaprga1 [Mycena belliae]